MVLNTFLHIDTNYLFVSGESAEREGGMNQFYFLNLYRNLVYFYIFSAYQCRRGQVKVSSKRFQQNSYPSIFDEHS